MNDLNQSHPLYKLALELTDENQAALVPEKKLERLASLATSENMQVSDIQRLQAVAETQAGKAGRMLWKTPKTAKMKQAEAVLALLETLEKKLRLA